MARNKIAEIMQPKSLSGGGTKLPKVSTPSISVNGAAAAAPTSAPPVTPQSLGGAVTPITQSQYPKWGKPEFQNDQHEFIPHQWDAPDNRSGRLVNKQTGVVAQAYDDPSALQAWVGNQGLGSNAETPAQQQQAPAQAPAQQPVYPAEQQTSQPGTQPPNTAAMNLTQDYTPLGADQSVAVMAGNMKPETFTNAVSLLKQINLGEKVPPGVLQQTQDIVIGDLNLNNLNPQELGAQVANQEKGQGLDPARTKEIIADEARQRGMDPEQAEKHPGFMQMLGDKWEGMDDSQRIGLAVGIPMALIGLFSGAMGGNKWISGALGLAGAAGVGHSMGLFDKLIPGMGKAQEGMKQLSSSMEGLNAMPDGPEKDYLTRQIYSQAGERGGGGFTALSMVLGTDANSLSSAYNQLGEAQEFSGAGELDMALRAHDQLPEGHPLRKQVFDQMQKGVKAKAGYKKTLGRWMNSSDDAMGRYDQLAKQYTPENNSVQEIAEDWKSTVGPSAYGI